MLRKCGDAYMVTSLPWVGKKMWSEREAADHHDIEKVFRFYMRLLKEKSMCIFN
jgi:hypothetical protein